MPPVQVVTDCEGPLALNDNAFELCRDFLGPEGERFFRQVSRYDDFLGGVLKKPGYRNGDTLKLILPFLLARGLTQEKLVDYCRRTVSLVPGAKSCYRFLHSLEFPLYMISTSYRPFAEAVGGKLGFRPERIFATEVDLSRYHLSEAEAARLEELQAEIARTPEIELPPGARSEADLSPATQAALRRLEEIFFGEIPDLPIGRLYEDIRPVGGEEKAEALRRSLAETGLKMANALYVGDSITDVEAFKAVRAGGGVSISFNGNRYAVEAAEFVVVADSAWPIALLTGIFWRWGKAGLLELAESTKAGHQKIIALPERMLEAIVTGLQGVTFNYYLSGGSRREQALQESLAMRARLRGEEVAALG
mgnify:CR=1 FL=1